MSGGVSGRRHRGVGMLEFLIALLIFCVGMMGLLAAQLAGKRASFDANQRSQATALARDILERLRANAGQLQAYQVTDVGDESSRQPLPKADCAAVTCTPEQLAAFDVWQWESQLLGESEQIGEENAGGLISPRGCIRQEDGTVTVSISWLGVTPNGPAAAIVCGENTGPGAPPGEGGETRQRHQLTIATFVAG